MPRRSGTRFTVGSLMLLVVITGAALGLFRYVSDARGPNWIDRLMVVHVACLGVIIPIGTFLAFLFLAAGRPDQIQRTRWTVVSGCLAWVLVFGSLSFWFIIMTIGASGF